MEELQYMRLGELEVLINNKDKQIRALANRDEIISHQKEDIKRISDKLRSR